MGSYAEQVKKEACSAKLQDLATELLHLCRFTLWQFRGHIELNFS